jgi:hypothetical protein
MSLVDKIKGAVFEDTAPKPVAKPVLPVLTSQGMPLQQIPPHIVTGIGGNVSASVFHRNSPCFLRGFQERTEKTERG